MTSITAPASGLDRFFSALRRSPLTRSPNGSVAGVCTGVADHFGVSLKAVRIATVLLAFIGPAIPLYLLAWLMLPDRTGSIHLERAIRQGRAASIALLVATVLAVLPDAHVHDHHHEGWGLLPFLALAVFLIAKSRGRRQQAQAPFEPYGTRRPDGPQDVRPS